MKDLKKTKKPEQKRVDKTSRSVKDRPQSMSELVSAIEGARVDGRTSHAKRLQQTRRALEGKAIETTASIVRDVLAVNHVVASYLIQQLCRADFEVLDSAGSLNPLLKTHWPDTVKSILTAAQVLQRLESATTAAPGKAKGDAPDPDSDQPVDISTLVLELSESSNK